MPVPRQSATAVLRIRARAAWLGRGRLTGPLELLVQGGKIRELRPLRHARVPDLLLLPGLVNAHVHLQLPALKAAPREFWPWAGRVMAERAGQSPAQIRATTQRHCQQLLADGVTAVGEVDALGSSPEVLRELPLAGRCYRELTGFHLAAAAARGLLTERRGPATQRCPAGWGPHAPYSVSPALFRAAVATRKPLTVHLAETPAETEFLLQGTGPCREILESLGRLPAGWRPPRSSPTAYLEKLGLLGPRTQLVHGQCIDAADAALIAASGASLVCCPGTIRFFGREAPDLPGWLRLGIPVGLGTDSRASNTGMSMRREMRWARRLWPELAPETVLELATRGGARALARPGLGALRVGAAADICAVAMPEGAAAALESFTNAESEVAALWLAGKRWGAADS